MIGWGWIIAAFVLGDLTGIIVMAILHGSWDKWEQKAEKKNRQRANADGSKGGSI